MARRIPRNYRAARELSDLARAKAFTRMDSIYDHEVARREALGERKRSQRPDAEAPIDVVVDTRVSQDPKFKVAVADNRWWMNTATMYAQGEIIERLDLIVGLLTQLAEMLNRRETRG